MKHCTKVIFTLNVHSSLLIISFHTESEWKVHNPRNSVDFNRQLKCSIRSLKRNMKISKSLNFLPKCFHTTLCKRFKYSKKCRHFPIFRTYIFMRQKSISLRITVNPLESSSDQLRNFAPWPLTTLLAHLSNTKIKLEWLENVKCFLLFKFSKTIVYLSTTQTYSVLMSLVISPI